MKHIKLYENFNELPEIGDYVLVDITDANKEYQNFINDNIGRIIFINNPDDWILYLEYENIPKNIRHMFSHSAPGKQNLTSYVTVLHVNDIKHFSKNKENLEAILASKKYNL